MSGYQPPWSDLEKYNLLAQILKVAPLPVGVLWNVIQSNGVQPNWGDMELPHGRSVNACRAAFEEMKRHPPPVTGTSSPLSGSTASKRVWGAMEGPTPLGREIRPKPLHASHAGYEAPPAVESPAPEQPPRKRRGRPPKAASLARAESAVAGPASRSTTASEAPPPSAFAEPTIRAASLPPSAAVSTANLQSSSTAVQTSGFPPSTMHRGPFQTRENQPMQPPITRIPITAMLTPTAAATASQSSSSSSSGKRRRRGLSTRTRPEDSPTGASSRRHFEQELESPFGDFGPTTGATYTRLPTYRERVDSRTTQAQQEEQHLPTTTAAGGLAQYPPPP